MTDPIFPIGSCRLSDWANTMFGQNPPTPKKIHEIKKGQGVKEFHMLAHIGSYCKMVIPHNPWPV